MLHLGRARCERGANALIEFALIGSFLATLITGMADCAIAVWERTQVQIAAEAGAAYASLHGYNSSNVQSAAQSATSLGTQISVTSSQSCGCATTSGIGSATCGSTCSGLNNAAAGTYVTVTATYTFSPPLRFPGFSNMTLTATTVARTS